MFSLTFRYNHRQVSNKWICLHTCPKSRWPIRASYLLFALFFSICSFWCTCHSSSSFLAFSFHSASAVLEAESYWRARGETHVSMWCRVCLQEGVRRVSIQYWLQCKNISRSAVFSLPSSSRRSFCSSLHLRRLSGSCLSWSTWAMAA